MAGYHGNLKLIAVTGPTGAGKSSFINLVCGSNLQVGQGLRSCTTQVDVAQCTIDGQSVVLIDTPGFDNIERSQADILRDIGRFFEESFNLGTRLSGVIYMHRISDRRVIARENLRLFEKICGRGAMKNVYIVTTMWEDVTEPVGRDREVQLASQEIFFRAAIEQGARMRRHYNNAQSATTIVKAILTYLPEKLQMQHEEERHQMEIQQLVDEIKAAHKNEISELRAEFKKTEAELRRIKNDEEKLKRGGQNTWNLAVQDTLVKFKRQPESIKSETIIDLGRLLLKNKQVEGCEAAHEHQTVEALILMLSYTLDTDPGLTIAVSPGSEIFKLLYRLCQTFQVSPYSYLIAPGTLTKAGDHPVVYGGFSEVWHGTYTLNISQRKVALKVIHIPLMNEQKVHKKIIKETIIWRYLKHPKLLSLLGIDTTIFPFCMISEWMENGNIASFLDKYPAENRLKLILDICDGLQYLHLNSLVHGDLKSNNILVNNNGDACLCDFGLTTIVLGNGGSEWITEQSSGDAGTIPYMAPELFDPEIFGFEHRNLSMATDVYALAIVIWEIFAGPRSKPYAAQISAAIMRKVLQGERPKRPMDRLSLGFSDTVWHLVEECWQHFPHMRPRIAQVHQTVTSAYSRYK